MSASEPITRLDGSALETGDTYYNTNDNILYYRKSNGTWDQVAQDPSQVTITGGSATGLTSISATTGTINTVNTTKLDFGDWDILMDGSSLVFKYQGATRFKLTSTGDLSVEGDLSAYDSL